MQFKVPQFLDIEDKIFGPFTFSEFVYLAGGAGICFVMYRAWGLLFGFIPILVVGAFSVALVFYKPNSKPFIDMVQAAFSYVFQNKLYIWRRAVVKKTKTATVDNIPPKLIRSGATETQRKVSAITTSNTQRLTGEKLRDLAWSLDVLDLKKSE
jgi:hypothetical protein